MVLEALRKVWNRSWIDLKRALKKSSFKLVILFLNQAQQGVFLAQIMTWIPLALYGEKVFAILPALRLRLITPSLC